MWSPRLFLDQGSSWSNGGSRKEISSGGGDAAERARTEVSGSLTLRGPRKQGRGGWPESPREGDRIKGKGDERKETGTETEEWTKKGWQKERERKEQVGRER